MQVVLVSLPPHATRVPLTTEREWPRLPFDVSHSCDKYHEENLPGSGKRGIVQVVFAGKISTSFVISSRPPPIPPVIMRPGQGRRDICTCKQVVPDFRELVF